MNRNFVRGLDWELEVSKRLGRGDFISKRTRQKMNQKTEKTDMQRQAGLACFGGGKK